MGAEVGVCIRMVLANSMAVQNLCYIGIYGSEVPIPMLAMLVTQMSNAAF